MKIPFGINIIDWSKSDKYTGEDDGVILPPILSESDKATDAAYDEHFKSKKNGGKAGNGKLQDKVKVESTQKKPVVEKAEKSVQVERDER